MSPTRLPGTPPITLHPRVDRSSAGVTGNLPGVGRRLPAVKFTVLLVVMPVVAAGCFGGSSEHGASPSTPPVAQSQPSTSATSLRISYPLKSALIRADLASCPADARCHDVQVPDCPPGGKCPVAFVWVRVASRRLTCPLVYGDKGGGPCAALEDLMRLRKGRHLGVCSCPGMATGYPRARAVGRYKGHRISIPLDVCSLCGVGRFARAAYRDAAILMPQR